MKKVYNEDFANLVFEVLKDTLPIASIHPI
jgi:hypothetical protein